MHTAPTDTVVIVDAAAMRDFTAAERLQRAVWGAAAPVVGVPQLVAAAHAGGTVLIAYDGDAPVGFCYGFVGLDEESDAVASGGRSEVILWSHMLAVVPSHRGRGLGVRLKRAQADRARRRGIRRILWTFDPLETANARLNLHRLGAIAARYRINRYGAMADDLNAGLETDRLIADWWVAPGGTNRPPDARGEELVVNPHGYSGPFLSSGRLRGHRGSAAVLAPAGDWRSDPAAARRWRYGLRAAFTAVLDAGFVAVDLQIDCDGARYRLVPAGGAIA